jgi:hypothetical protein
MRKITAIPSKKITFKNVPISGLFYYKRTLYKKTSAREGCQYYNTKQVYFEANEIVRFIAKAHENIAIELCDEKNTSTILTPATDFKINDSVEILSKSTLGKIASINKNNCLIQYKNNQTKSISFDEFPFSDLKKIV